MLNQIIKEKIFFYLKKIFKKIKYINNKNYLPKQNFENNSLIKSSCKLLPKILSKD